MSTSARAPSLPKENPSPSAAGASGAGGLSSTRNSFPEGRWSERFSGRVRLMPESVCGAWTTVTVTPSIWYTVWPGTGMMVRDPPTAVAPIPEADQSPVPSLLVARTCTSYSVFGIRLSRVILLVVPV